MVRVMLRNWKHLLGTVVFLARGGVVHARWKGVKIGEDCRIYIRNFGSEPFLISIGNRVTITSGVRLLTHDGSTWMVRNENGNRYQNYSSIKIGDDVFIGVNSIILPGVTIGDRVVIGAGSIVTKDIPDGAVIAGNPARVVGTFDDFETRIRTTCANDQELKHIVDYEKMVLHSMKIKKRKI